jgi:hypothetical protein
VEHLHRNYFYIVAAGQVESIATIYGFISGHVTPSGSDGQDTTTSVLFLMELKVYFGSPLVVGSESEGGGMFECVCKCTDPRASALCIQMMHLGDVLQQQTEWAPSGGGGGGGVTGQDGYY